jgi:hypothetical protein
MRTTRLVLVGLVVLPLVLVVGTNPVVGGGGPAYSTGETVADPAPGRTVVTGTEFVVVDERGVVGYHETRRDEYWDVDPIRGTSSSVVVSTVTHDPSGVECSACVVQRIERLNVSTGSRSTLYREVTPGRRDVEWHDVDRINRTHYVIADIAQNEVRVVDVSRDITVWAWSAHTDLQPSSGGAFGDDWTHLNDVEIVRDGQYVTASLRNQDTVLFIDRTSGEVNQTLSLGRDDAHSILDEQHNPDYIPEAHGGPAIVVADSNNDRVVEYQFEDGQWTESWVWQDTRLQWPRDADRLPNGHTLVTDTNGNRVVEVDERGGVHWSVSTPIEAYEAERLSTPDESGNGTAADDAGLVSRTADPETPGERARAAATATFGPRVVNGIVLVTPSWMRLPEFAAAALSLVSLLSLAGYELSVRGVTPSTLRARLRERR